MITWIRRSSSTFHCQGRDGNIEGHTCLSKPVTTDQSRCYSKLYPCFCCFQWNVMFTACLSNWTNDHMFRIDHFLLHPKDVYGKHCKCQEASFSAGKETLCIDVVQIHKKEECICRKLCVWQLLLVDKTQRSIHLDIWHRQKPRNN